MAFPKNHLESCPIFQNFFTALPDPRRHNKGNFNYPFNEILFLSISAVISGMDNWTAISNFGKIKLEWLRCYFPFESGIPSHDVLGNVFAKIDPVEFSACFTNWINALSELTQGEVVAIDGKTIRGSDDKNVGRQAFHVVSAYATDNRICLGQHCVDQKSNEIIAIPQLLDLLLLKDTILTIDAMGCQKLIAEKIIDKQADYVLMVKDNQKHLKEAIAATFEENIPFESDKKHDLGHGRTEIRTCHVSENLSLIGNKNQWKGLQTIIKINSERTNKQSGSTTMETRYYISSLPPNASHLNGVIRKHWGIENKLHWVLDVVFREDQALKKKGYSAINYNIINKIALSLIDKDTENKKSKIVKRQTAALDDEYRAKILNI